jgi:hypothetical protein
MVAPQPPQNLAVEGISALQVGHFIVCAPSSESWEISRTAHHKIVPGTREINLRLVLGCASSLALAFAPSSFFRATVSLMVSTGWLF